MRSAAGCGSRKEQKGPKGRQQIGMGERNEGRQRGNAGDKPQIKAIDKNHRENHREKPQRKNSVVFFVFYQWCGTPAENRTGDSSCKKNADCAINGTGRGGVIG